MSQVELWWPGAPRRPALAARHVHVWCAPLDQEASRVEALFHTLSVPEQERAQRYYFARDRRRFIVGRGLLREMLSRYLDLPPRQVEIAYGRRGKPGLALGLVSVAPQAMALRFNLSHAGGLALYAFTRGREIGVDIEQLRELEDAERLASRYFAAGEVRVFRSLSASAKLEGFFNCWTRKEAYIKATGDGLSMPLDGFAVSMRPGEPARFLRLAGDAAALTRWSLRALHPAPGYAAAVCVEGDGWELQCWHWR